MSSSCSSTVQAWLSRRGRADFLHPSEPADSGRTASLDCPGERRHVGLGHWSQCVGAPHHKRDRGSSLLPSTDARGLLFACVPGSRKASGGAVRPLLAVVAAAVGRPLVTAAIRAGGAPPFRPPAAVPRSRWKFCRFSARLPPISVGWVPWALSLGTPQRLGLPSPSNGVRSRPSTLDG